MTRTPLLGPLLAVAFAAASLCDPAQAFGADGHRLIAEFAEVRLTPAARTEVLRLLALEPGSTLPSISTWADEVRSPTTAAWHYVNFARDAQCSYAPERNCIQGTCVVGATERQIASLADRKANDEDRLKALKWVVHLVADAHQPLHAGFADDRGGNSFQVQAFGRGTNLHSVWDSGLIRDWPGGLPALRTAMDAATPGDQGAAAQWAEESCKAVSAPGFYPEDRTLTPDYGNRWNATLVQRLASAGHRLARVLNAALGTQ